MSEARHERSFGRYLVLESLGTGGMGVVLSAYDPELDRRVAIKVLRPQAIADGSKLVEHTVRLDRSGDAREQVRERILAEGRAMARLSHPNLVSVFEVGAVADQVFLVMEQVDGVALDEWCGAEPRTWQEILAAFIGAGRGLAAAHAADLVHGDFKPENVLVDATGRARVIDFGLARAVGTRGPHGTLAGTPRFMAPELLRGQPADPRADQYAFALALYHALYGDWPCLEPDLLSPPPEPPFPRAPAARNGPRWLERAVLRALAPSADDRFAGMAELLAALDRPAAGRRRLAVAGVVGGLAIAVVALVLRGAGDAAETCRGAEELAAGVWSPSVRARVRGALQATGRSHASDTADRVSARIDRAAAEWVAQRRDACEDTRLRGEQSEELLDRRMACLDRQLGQLRAATELLAGADAAVADRAVDVVAGLPPAAACADAERLLGAAPPGDAAARRRVGELERAVDRAEAARRAGRYQAAADAARGLYERARAMDAAPVAAEAGALLARSLEAQGRPADAEKTLLAALELSARARDEVLGARAMIDLVRVVGFRQRRRAEAATLGQLAQAWLARVPEGSRADLRARLLQARGDVHYGAGESREAEPLYREALALRRAAADAIQIGDAEMRIGLALDDLGRHAEAREHLRRVLEIRRRELGPDHPGVADMLSNLGRSYDQEGAHEQARTALLQAIEVLERVGESNSLPSALMALGGVETALGRFDDARARFARGRGIVERTLGPDHPVVGGMLYNQSALHVATGDATGALALLERALAIQVTAMGDRATEVGISEAAMAEVLGRLGRWQEAREHSARSASILRERVGDEHAILAEPFTYGGLAQVELGEPAAAIAQLERAAAVRIGGAEKRAESAFVLARALWDTGRDRRRARALAREALRVLAAAGPRWSDLTGRVQRWLASRAGHRGGRRRGPPK